MELNELNNEANNTLASLATPIGGNGLNDIINRSMGVANMMRNNNGLNELLKQRKSINGMLGIDRFNDMFKPNDMFGLGAINNMLNTSLKANTILDSMKPYYGINSLSYNNAFEKIISNSVLGKAGEIAAMTGFSKGIDAFIKSNNHLNDKIGGLISNQSNIIGKIAQLDFVNHAFFKQNNAFSTLGGLSAKLAIQGFAGALNDKYFEDAEDITLELSEIAETITEENEISEELIKRLLGVFQIIQNTLFKGEPQALFSMWVSIVGLILTMYSLSPSSPSTSDEQYLTNEKYHSLNEKFKDSIIASFNIYKAKRILDQPCKLYTKPKLQSTILRCFNKNDSVLIINTNHKWVQLTCLDSEGLPVTGWILKKYLSKAKNIK